MREFIFAILATVVVIGAGTASGQTTRPGDDAEILYSRAAQALAASKVYGPTSSATVFPAYPPYPAEWWKMEKASWEANRVALQLVHQARGIYVGHWPNDLVELLPLMNQYRALANEVADAAMYEHVQGGDAEAIESIRDLMHLADMLLIDGKEQDQYVPILVSGGMEAMAAARLETITAGVKLTRDPTNHKDLPTGAAWDMCNGLMGPPLYDVEKLSSMPLDDEDKGEKDRFVEMLRRVNAERQLAGMSIRCHLFYLDHNRWPSTATEVFEVREGKVILPVDPWGDGKQTLGYMLIKGGLPDGGDRPLVYSRDLSRDGLFYRVDKPEVGFSEGDGSGRSWNKQKQGGQFRDVAAWVPPEGYKPSPTTRQLP